MNERIKELAKQAGFYFYDLHDVDGQDYGETIEADSWEAANKFAELIVKDCVTYIESEIDRLVEYRNSMEEWDKNRQEDVDLCIEKCYDNISGLKQYFGIE